MPSDCRQKLVLTHTPKWQNWLYTSGCPSVVPRLAALTVLVRLSKMQILGPYPRYAASEAIELELSGLCFQKPSR